MEEEINIKNVRIYNFQHLMTLTFTLNWVTWYTIMHHSSTSTYVTNFIQIGKTLRMDVCTYVQYITLLCQLN